MAFPSNVVVTQFQSLCDMIFFRMLQHRLYRFRITSSGLAFYRSTLHLIADKEIKFHAAVIVIIIQFTPHLAKDVGHIHLELTLNSVSVKRQFRYLRIVATANDVGIFNPLQATGIIAPTTSKTDYGITISDLYSSTIRLCTASTFNISVLSLFLDELRLSAEDSVFQKFVFWAVPLPP